LVVPIDAFHFCPIPILFFKILLTLSKWLFIAHTIPNVGGLFQPYEEYFILAVTGHSPSGDLERDLLVFPT